MLFITQKNDCVIVYFKSITSITQFQLNVHFKIYTFHISEDQLFLPGQARNVLFAANGEGSLGPEVCAEVDFKRKINIYLNFCSSSTQIIDTFPFN